MKSQNGQLELFSHVNTTPSKSCSKSVSLELELTHTCWTRRRQMWPRTVIHVSSKLFLSPLWKVTHCPDWIHLTWKSNFRIFLLLGCHGQESNTSRFSMRKYGQSHGDPSCRLCGAALEDPTHFILSGSMLEANRRELLSHSPQPTTT